MLRNPSRPTRNCKGICPPTKKCRSWYASREKTPPNMAGRPQRSLDEQTLSGFARFSVASGSTGLANLVLTSSKSGHCLRNALFASKGLGCTMRTTTKIAFNFNGISRLESLDQLGALLFPSNKNHQKLFLAIFIELKYADHQFLSSLEWVADKYGLSRRVLEVVRAKMRLLGLIDHVSRFNAKHGYREGWVFSHRFAQSCLKMSKLPDQFREIRDAQQEQRDRDLFRYL